MRAALELALLDRFRADSVEGDSEATYTKAFKVLAIMEAEPGTVVAARVARFVEDSLGCHRPERCRMSLRADEGRLVDWFLIGVRRGLYDG